MIKITSNMELAESPFWDAKNKKIYWLDILKKRLYFLKNNSIEFKQYFEYPSFIFQNEKNELAIAFEDGVYFLDENYERKRKYISFDKDGFRCNDGGISPEGTLFIGRINNLYNYGEKQLEYDGKLLLIKNKKKKEIFSNVGISNGICWNSLGNKVYYIDSLTKTIRSFSYNKGNFLNPKILYKTKDGVPDGMTIDEEDNLWIAIYGEGTIICLNPITQKIKIKYHFYEKNVTSCCFIGENLDKLLVTTASSSSKDIGSVYILNLEDIKGKEKNKFIEGGNHVENQR